MLDIGAGDGSITHFFEPYVEKICCLEPSVSFQKTLQKRGYKIVQSKDAEHYNVVTIFNVLDICQHPEEILEKAIKNLLPSGILVISLPFPIRTRSWDQKKLYKTNPLGQSCETSFEEGASRFYEEFLTTHGLKVTGFTRLPYLVALPEGRDVTVYDN